MGLRIMQWMAGTMLQSFRAGGKWIKARRELSNTMWNYAKNQCTIAAVLQNKLSRTAEWLLRSICSESSGNADCTAYWYRQAWLSEYELGKSFGMQQIFQNTARDLSSMQMELPGDVKVMLTCYAGDCSSCQWHEYVNVSHTTNNNWWCSMFLASLEFTHLSLQESGNVLL